MVVTRKRMAAVGAAALVLVTAARAFPSKAQTQKTVAQALKISVFPSAGQNAEQQSIDESACYKWAVNDTGVDPFEAKKQAKQQKAQAQANAEATKAAGEGAGAKGAVKGAAAGALVGAIAGDTGKGAAIGAGAGLIAGRSRRRGANEQAEANAAAQSQQVDQQMQSDIQNFKNAFSACLESKKYMVKY